MAALGSTFCPAPTVCTLLASEETLAGLQFPHRSVGGHRIQPAVAGARRALVAACAGADVLENILLDDRSFEDRYARIRGARLPQWGRTTTFDLLLRAGALGIGGHFYEPRFAQLDGSTGPKKGFKKIWGVEITGENAAWGEAVLRAWTDEWERVAAEVGVQWDGEPYTPADFENTLCIWQERRYDSLTSTSPSHLAPRETPHVAGSSEERVVNATACSREASPKTRP